MPTYVSPPANKKRKAIEENDDDGSRPPKKFAKRAIGPRDEIMDERQTRPPILNPVRKFDLASTPSLRENIDVWNNIRFFDMNPEIMVIDSIVALTMVNTPMAAGTYAAFFASDNELNTSGLLPREVDKVSSSAESFVATLALKKLRAQHDITPSCIPARITTLVLHVTSSWLPNNMDNSIARWEKNDWKNVKSKPLPHAALIKDLLAECHYFERALGLEVKFWYEKGRDSGPGEKIARKLLEEMKKTMWRGPIPTGPKAM